MHELFIEESRLTRQLMEFARDSVLRQAVYERLGEYCHQCRNRLNSLKLSLYLVKRQSLDSPCFSDWLALESHYQDLERRVDRLQTICRPMTLSKVKLGLDLLIEDRREAWTQVMATQGRELSMVAPRSRAIAFFDVERMSQALDAVVAWRAGEFDSAQPVEVRWWVDGSMAHLTWHEENVQRREIPPDPENAWPLPILARVLSAHEGDLIEQHDGGWRIHLSWPATS